MPRTLLTLLLASLCLAFGVGLSTASDGITYQAEVRQDGNIPPDGNYFFHFELYDALESGTMVWTQEDSLQVTSGVVNTVFESLDPNWFQTYPELFLEVTLNGELLGARTRLEAVPYAFVARHAAVADSCTNCGGGSGGDSVWEVNPNGIHYNGGNVGIGTEEPERRLTVKGGGGLPAQLKLMTDEGDAQLEIEQHTDGPDAGDLLFRKGRGNYASPTIPQQDDQLGRIRAFGFDGNSYLQGAAIGFHVDGEAGSGDMPSRISFHTTPDGSSTMQERLRVSNAGDVGIGVTTPLGRLHVQGNASGDPTLRLQDPTRPLLQFSDGNSAGGYISQSGPTTLLIGDSSDPMKGLTIDRANGHIGIGTNDPSATVTIIGIDSALNGPVLNLAGDASNHFESGRIRFTEKRIGVSPYFQGAFIHYNGVENSLNIGMHPTADNSEANDVNSISIDRATGVVTINGDLCVTGQKNRMVETSIGKTLLNAVESAEAWFTMSGEARLQSGSCEIQLSPHFMETVTVSDQYPMQVDINFYAPHGNYYVERGTTSFKVIDQSGSSAAFSWRVTARQKGYENVTLETKK